MQRPPGSTLPGVQVWASETAHKIRPQPIQSTVFISHLTNSNGCGNLQAKVLLTLSPFLPSFLPQSGVFPRVSSLSALESALTKNGPVTPLDSAQKHRGWGPASAQAPSLEFSGAYRLFRSVSLAFRHPLPLFSTVCSLFFQNTGGWGSTMVFLFAKR